MVDIVLDEEYHRFLEQMYREEKINAFNLVDDIRQLSYEQIAKASRYVRALKNGFQNNRQNGVPLYFLPAMH